VSTLPSLTMQSTESASELEAMIVKSKKAGTVLKMILHSRACCSPKGCCSSTPNCWALRKLIKHVFQCRLKSEGDCKVSGCRTVRTLLDHERSCQNAALVDLSQGREPSACIICTVAGVDHRRNSTPPTLSLFCGGGHGYIAEEKDDCDAQEDEIQSFRPSWLSNSSSGSGSVGGGSSASSMDDLYSLTSSCSASDPIESSAF